jgi:hypothetical protein
MVLGQNGVALIPCGQCKEDCADTMNERIRQLAEQAREFATTRHPVSNIVLSVNSEKFEEKFAELIVLECAVIVGSMEEPHQDIAKLIKQHFGVEE